MSRSEYNAWLHRFALLTALATLVLIAIGGLVTSKGVGMSVPDWPTSYGYNMFLFPISKWVGGIFYEHTHRLVATVVGVLVVALTRWLGGSPSRKPLAIIGLLQMAIGYALLLADEHLKGAGYGLLGIGVVVLLAGIVPGRDESVRKPLGMAGMVVLLAGGILLALNAKFSHVGLAMSGIGVFLLLVALLWARNEPANKTLRVMGWFAFVAVQIQGLLGGLRVVLYYDWIGIFHAALAQAFFVLLCAIVLLTSRWWLLNSSKIESLPDRFHLRPLFAGVAALIFLQLILGATMRHAHAGLAIPDFPLAYHKLWPPMDAASVASYNDARLQVNETNPITAFQIALQMVHRLIALLIACAIAWCAFSARRLGSRHPLARWSLAWLGLVLCQILLGAATIWSNKAADVASLHVLVGAVTLVFGALLTIVSFRVLMSARVAVSTASSPAFVPVKPAVSGAK